MVCHAGVVMPGTEQESMTTEMTLKLDTAYKGGDGVEVGCKEAYRGSRKNGQLK